MKMGWPMSSYADLIPECLVDRNQGVQCDNQDVARNVVLSPMAIAELVEVLLSLLLGPSPAQVEPVWSYTVSEFANAALQVVTSGHVQMQHVMTKVK